MKNILLLIISLICCFPLCSCNLTSLTDNSSGKYDPSDIFANDYPFAKETMLTVLKCFDEKDKETLKSLFSESVTSNYDLDKQIEEAFNCYEGKSKLHDDVRSGDCQTDCRKDHYAYKSVRTRLDNIITDNNKKYMLVFVYVLVDEEDATQIGLLQLNLCDANDLNKGSLCFIGEKI